MSRALSNYVRIVYLYSSFFFNDTATTEIYTLSLHRRSSDLLVVRDDGHGFNVPAARKRAVNGGSQGLLSMQERVDRKSTRLNSSHGYISYAVFCLKKKTTNR